MTDGYSHTPLFFAVLNGNNEVVKVLLAHGADVNIKNNNGDKTYFYSCFYRRLI
jgi:ankyrin repeat protein